MREKVEWCRGQLTITCLGFARTWIIQVSPLVACHKRSLATSLITAFLPSHSGLLSRLFFAVPAVCKHCSSSNRRCRWMDSGRVSSLSIVGPPLPQSLPAQDKWPSLIVRYGLASHLLRKSQGQTLSIVGAPQTTPHEQTTSFSPGTQQDRCICIYRIWSEMAPAIWEYFSSSIADDLASLSLVDLGSPCLGL